MTDYVVSETQYIAFTTRAFASGIPTVLAGVPVVSAYEDAGLTQITAGITLGVDHDGVVGLNMLTIVATGANGYEAGKSYNLVVTTGTVGGVSVVGEVVGQFTLGRSAAAVDLANATDGLSALKTLIDAAQTDLDTLTAGVALTAAGVDAIWDEPMAGHTTADTSGLVMNEWQDGGRLDLILDIVAADTTTDIPALIATAQADLDIITGASGVNLLTATQASIDAIEVDTSTTLQAELDAIQAAVITNAAGADIAADIIAMKVDTAAILVDTGTTLDGRIPAALVGGLMSSDVTAISTSTAAADNLEASAETIIIGAAEAGTLSTTVMTSDLAEATDDHYNGRIVIWTSGVLLGQATDITDYLGSTGQLTFTAVTEAPSAADTFVIV